MKKQDTVIYLTAICFARMYGAFETLEDIPNADFNEVSKMVLMWAEEYVHSGQNDDMVAFFEQKSNGLKKG